MSKKKNKFPEGLDADAISREISATGDNILQDPKVQEVLAPAIEMIRDRLHGDGAKVAPIFDGDKGAVDAYTNGIKREVMKGISKQLDGDE